MIIAALWKISPVQFTLPFNPNLPLQSLKNSAKIQGNRKRYKRLNDVRSEAINVVVREGVDQQGDPSDLPRLYRETRNIS